MLHVWGETASEHFVLARRNAIFVPRLRQNGLRAFWLATLKLRFCPTSSAKRLFSILADGNLKLGLGAARAPLGRRRVFSRDAIFAPRLRGNGLRAFWARKRGRRRNGPFCSTSAGKWPPTPLPKSVFYSAGAAFWHHVKWKTHFFANLLTGIKGAAPCPVNS